VNMRAILLAAGSGRPLQRPYPKCLVEIGAMTLLSRALRALAAVGVSQAWVGFYKLDRSAAQSLRWLLEAWVASGGDDQDYEGVFRSLGYPYPLLLGGWRCSRLTWHFWWY
jgi:GTP:adenosylcobinamide-phosphate guanylyltransferase